MRQLFGGWKPQGQGLLLALLFLLPGRVPAGTADSVAIQFYGGGERPRTPVASRETPEQGLLDLELPPSPQGSSSDQEPQRPVEPEVSGSTFPGFESEAVPRGVRVLSRAVRVRVRPVVGDMDLRIRLILAPEDFTRIEYRFWLDPSVDLREVATSLGKMDFERRGSEVLVRLAYPAYQRELEISLLARRKIEGSVMELPRGRTWLPEFGGPGPATQLELLCPAGWTAFSEGVLKAREAVGELSSAKFTYPGGVTPGVLIGPWVGLSGRRVDLYALGKLDRGDQDLADFLDRCLEVFVRASGSPEDQRFPVLVMPGGSRPRLGAGILVLDQEDEGWRDSWSELARRLLRAAWPLPEKEGGWVDEAIPAYLAVPASARGGDLQWPREAVENAPLVAPPTDGWNGPWLRWAERTRLRGVVVLRALRAILGKDSFLQLIRSLYQRATQGLVTDSEALRVLVARPELDAFFRGVVARGHGLDFKVEEIRARGAQRHGDLQGDIYGTWVRLRLGRGEAFRGPVPVVLETDLGRVRKIIDWKQADTEMEFHTRSRVRRVQIDPGGWYPDPRPGNNTLAFEGFYREEAPDREGNL